MTELVHHRIRAVALERSLRASTVRSYMTLLGRIGLLEREVTGVTREEALELIWTLESVNTRRSTAIALRSVVPSCAGLKIPKGVARHYDLPDETMLRFALSLTPHQVRGELMAYGGLRSGEAAAITRRDVNGDQLLVTKQVSEETGKLGPVKTVEGTVTIPLWLAERLQTVEETVQPASVRESFRRAGRKCGIHLSPHMLRKWHITKLIEAGVPLELVRQQARHSHIATTLTHYQEFSPQQIHEVFPG
jgi:integrase